MPGMKIGEVARRTGLRTSAIRYYESVGLLPEPQRTHGQRSYDGDIFWRLSLIDSARASGFSIREIRALLHGFPEGTAARDRWASLAGAKLHEIERQIVKLQQIRVSLQTALACQCAGLDECARRLQRDSGADCC